MNFNFKSAEFLLVVVIAVLLAGSLLSQQFLDLPYQIISFLIFAFIVLKVVDISKAKGTIFEDYFSLAVIIILGVVHFLLGERVNSIIIVVMVFVLVYSVGLVPWINDLLKSRRVSWFIGSYAFFAVMIVFLFAGIYFANNGDFFYLGVKTDLSFEDSLYFSAISFTTVGYGDIAPVGINRLVASIQAIFGMILNIVFIGYILASKRFRR
ncbi:MAG: potassium channel family protein [archaeon]